MKRPPVDRFLEKVQKGAGTCWLWTAHTDPGGYGVFRVDRDTVIKAHRWSYQHHVGPIPAGLDLDHLCRVRNCVNPDHLEPVTRAENIRRSPITRAALLAALTHCKWGHEFSVENTARGGPHNQRVCRACARRRTAAYRLRRAGQAVAA